MTTTDITSVTRIALRWDAQPGAEAGWHCEAFSGERLVIDSQKISFPVDVECYDDEERDELVEALTGAFPGAAIDAE